MTQHQIRILTRLRHVQAFMNAVADEYPLLANAPVARHRLDHVVAQLTIHMADQAELALVLRAAAQHQYASRETLYSRYMLPLCRVASFELEDQYALEPFRMPRKRTSVERLAGRIHTLLGEARKLAHILDAFVTAAFSSSPRELARWRAVK